MKKTSSNIGINVTITILMVDIISFGFIILSTTWELAGASEL